MSGLRHKSTMEEAINNLTSEMVRSCHMSSFYKKKWGTATKDTNVVTSLTMLASEVGSSIEVKSQNEIISVNDSRSNPEHCSSIRTIKIKEKYSLT